MARNPLGTGASAILHLPEVFFFLNRTRSPAPLTLPLPRCSHTMPSDSTARMSAGGECSAPVAPPAAKKVEHRMEMFGDVRIDNYYWLCDDSVLIPISSPTSARRMPTPIR
ncbi:hypothetical protein NL676_037529 [Syzygium grande]|nr:hypothetical protein NL676_037529 [Syzygium grande]